MIAKDWEDEKKEAPGRTVIVAYVICTYYFASIDQVWILFSFLWVWANSKHSILALQVDFNVLRQNARQKSWNSDTQIDIHAILNLFGSSTDDF